MKRFCLLLLCLALLTGCGAVPVREKDCFTVGFDAERIPVDRERLEDYYVAGYRNGQTAAGVLDEQQVKAVVLDDNSGNGPVVLVSVDCVGLSSADVSRIRSSLRSFLRKTGCRALHITATHDHAGADTLGLWGPEGIDGKDDAFMNLLRKKTALCVRQAFENRTDGELYFGSADTSAENIQEDTRAPIVFDPNLYSFRFVPFDETKPSVRLLNYASHAESLDGSNRYLSADFPRFVADGLREANGSETLWFPGAIGGLIRTRFAAENRLENCRETAESIVDAVLSIENETRLEPEITCASERFSVPCENTLFLAMKFLGILEQRSHISGGRVWLETEVSALRIGSRTVLLLPGEIFPELVYGGSDTPLLPDLCSVFGDDLLVFGLTDDEIGYIVPPESFRLSEEKPYVDTEPDETGENHYEETNSLGPETARLLYEAAVRLQEKLS